MRYISTRGRAPVLDFEGVLLAGLASDGGLYVPETWPRLSEADIRGLGGLGYAEVATRVMLPFIGGAIGEDDFADMVAATYRGFRHPEVAPLREIGRDKWLLELFHGPTLSFKDYALQLVGRLFEHLVERRGRRLVIIGATSGDTGSAAIEACRDLASVEIFMLHPRGRVSEVQRRQMTTVHSPNVHNLAIEGTFDDCQELVKSLFNDPRLRRRHDLSAVKSINWARIMAQTVYYFAAAAALGAPERKIVFAVPSGNFGNVYAAYAARRMGLGVERLIVGSNRNDILTRFLDSGVMETEAVVPTLSPSMDIQVSSNFERLMFDVMDGDGARLTDLMEGLRRNGSMTPDEDTWRHIRRLFAGHRLDDEGTLAAIRRHHDRTGEFLDPHTAIGVAAGDALHQGTSPLVAIATAHPAKFPQAVERATGIVPPLPAPLDDLMERRESFDELPGDLDRVLDFVTQRLSARTGN